MNEFDSQSESASSQCLTADTGPVKSYTKKKRYFKRGKTSSEQSSRVRVKLLSSVVDAAVPPKDKGS